MEYIFMRWKEIKEKRMRLEDSETILINPIFNELNTFIQKCEYQSVRGFSDEYGDVYVWDAMYASHGIMKTKHIENAINKTSFFIATEEKNLSPTWGPGGFGAKFAHINIQEIKGLYVAFSNKLNDGNNARFWRMFK